MKSVRWFESSRAYLFPGGPSHIVGSPRERGGSKTCGAWIAGKPEAQAEWNTLPTTRDLTHSTRLAPRASRRMVTLTIRVPQDDRTHDLLIPGGG